MTFSTRWVLAAAAAIWAASFAFAVDGTANRATAKEIKRGDAPILVAANDDDRRRKNRKANNNRGNTNRGNTNNRNNNRRFNNNNRGNSGSFRLNRGGNNNFSGRRKDKPTFRSSDRGRKDRKRDRFDTGGRKTFGDTRRTGKRRTDFRNGGTGKTGGKRFVDDRGKKRGIDLKRMSSRKSARDTRLRRSTTRVRRMRGDRVFVRSRRFTDRRGRVVRFRSRRVWVRLPRYRNRFRRGRSVYFLPPAGIALAPALYYVYMGDADEDMLYDTLMAPPVVAPSRRYSLDEIVDDPEIRSTVRSVDVNTINFDSNEATLSERERDKLASLARAIKRIVRNKPDERILIEGYTDATGEAEDNMELSELRAETVMLALVEDYGIPASNLKTVGYGEQYLLIDTDESERKNRRVVVRRVTDIAERGGDGGDGDGDGGDGDDKGDDSSE